MNATCRQLELIGQSQGEKMTEGVARSRVIQFFETYRDSKANGAQTTNALRWEIAGRLAAERRQAAAVLRDPWEELVYALLAAAGLVGIALGAFGILDAVSPAPIKPPVNVREVVGVPVSAPGDGSRPEGKVLSRRAELQF